MRTVVFLFTNMTLASALRYLGTIPAVLAVLCCTANRAWADGGHRFVDAYPEHLSGSENGDLIWRDGSRMELGDVTHTAEGRAHNGLPASHAEWLQGGSLSGTLFYRYAAGALSEPPARNADPGRSRHMGFFTKMYGDCRKAETQKDLVWVDWLAGKGGGRIQVTKVNGVAARLSAISGELEALPPKFDKFLIPAGGGFNCRQIAGTDRLSAHGFGIAVDIAVKPADYWRWHAKGGDGPIPYRNRVPFEIVEIFERHGFIWGGKWYHYDTMHFEYRPELLPPTARLPKSDVRAPR